MSEAGVNAVSRSLRQRAGSALSNRIVVALLVAVALFVAGGIVAPGFLHVNHLMTLLGLSAFLGIIAAGQTAVVIAGGEGMDLSVGAVASLSAVMASQMIQGHDSSLPLALIVILLTGFIVGAANGAAISYFRVPPLVMTLAMASVVGGFAIVYTGGQPTGSASPIVKAVGSGRIGPLPIIVIAWAVLVVMMVFALERTRWGRKLYGVGANEVTARLSGARTRLIRAGAYCLSGVLSAFGGLCLLGYTGTPYLDLGSIYVMPTIVAVVIGGISLSGGGGSYLGVVVGAIVLTTLDSLLITLRLGAGGRQVVYGIVVLVVLTAYSRQRRDGGKHAVGA